MCESLAMRVLFLDIDGVLNCRTTRTRHQGMRGIDQRLVRILSSISQAIPDLKIVLSSSWRLHPDNCEHVARVLSYHDVTPDFGYEIDAVRGYEIQAWIELNPSVTRYAIIDDEDQLLPHQRPHFFRTRMNVGITQSIADKIVAHLIRERDACTQG